jgi:phosphatidylglycerophosphatase A
MNSEKLVKVWQSPYYFIGFGFGTGLAPIAPGTWGTVAAIPIYLLINHFPWWLYLSIVMIGFILGVVASDKISNELGVHDYGGIVWDEVIGFLITMFLIPPQLVWIIMGFILFRIFDIWKPFPIKKIEKKVQGGLGVMLDDVLAAIYAWLILYSLVWLAS